MAIILRKEKPRLYKRYQSYKPYLRKDFNHRCAYCTLHEGELGGGGQGSFCVEHFRPKRKFPELECTYSNLYYACRRCNSYKSDTWPSKKLINKGFFFVDPCKEDLYEKHTKEFKNGALKHTTNAGNYTIEKIRLNSKFLVKIRKQRSEACKQIDKLHSDLASLRRQGIASPEYIDLIEKQIELLRDSFLTPLIPD